VIWGAAVVAYTIGVLHRSSFGVAGIAASERLGVSATALSTFVVVQLSVYALGQIPSGLLLDRFGSRRMIAGGALLMALGQLLLATATELPMVYLARVLIGAGDAATFLAVVRLVALWFPARQVPVLTQLSGILGQLGQVASALPVVTLLQLKGWTPTFVGLAAVGVLAAALAWLAIRDVPRQRVAGPGTLASVREVSRHPGTWLGFFSHAISQFSLNVFMMLWGFPFLLAEGLSSEAAGGVLTVAVVASMVSGPVIGVLTTRYPMRRSWLVIGTALMIAGGWAVVLLWPGAAPTGVLMLLAALLGIGGPASLVGFDFARTFNRPARLGTATGLVNAGGFSFAVLAVLAVGVVLDAYPGPALSLDAFRMAFASQGVFWLAAMAGLLVSRGMTRRTMASAGVVVPPVREILARQRDGRAVDGLSRDGVSGSAGASD
jgi:MFS family permease